MKTMLQILLMLLPYFVHSSSTESEKYEAIAHKLFNHEMFSIQDAFGMEYQFIVSIKLDNWATYEYKEYVEISEDKPRKFEVTHEKGTQSTFFSTKDSKEVTLYPMGTILEIINLEHIVDEKRIRGQVKETLDWISLKNTHTKYMWVRPVNPAKIIKFTVNRSKDGKKLHDKKLEIEFTQIDTITKQSTDEEVHAFFNMFDKIYEHSPYDTKIQLKDIHNIRLNVDKNILKSNLKFTNFLKHGITFFEKFNFEYIETVPYKWRQFGHEKLTFEEFKNITSKIPQLNYFSVPKTFSELVEQIERCDLSKEEFGNVFLEIFTNTSRFQNFIYVFPTSMVYKPSTQKRFNIENQGEKRKFSLFPFKASNKKGDDLDNYL